MRKLAAASLSFSIAICMANYLIPLEWLVLIAVFTTVIGAALFAMRRNRFKTVASVLLFFSLGLICYNIHNRNTIVKASQYSGETHTVTAEILDYPDVYEDYCRLEVRITSSNLPNFKAILYDNEKQLIDARPGYTVSLRAKINTADTIYGEKYDNYHSKGIYFKLSSKGDLEVHEVLDISYLPQYVSHWLSGRINEIFPDDTEVFMRSLMMGDKSDFYDDEELYAALSRAGLMHIVAVSGMHVSFLVGLLHSMFGRGRKGALLCIIFLWFFALVTGAGPSVLRAAFMQTSFLMAPVLRRENDSLTSLSFILALILLDNPFAIASISLQLSFAAMSGIVLFSNRIYLQFVEKIPRAMESSFLRGIISSVSCSLSVMVFTMPLTAMHFGNIQLLAVVSNLISLWAVSICFCWGWISCALSIIPIIGIVSAQLCSWLARYIFLAAKLISSVPFSVMYMQSYAELIWLIAVYVLLGLAYISRRTKFSTYIAIVLFSSISAGAIISFNSAYFKKNESVNILNVGQGQCISVLTDEATLILDCGNMNTINDAAVIAAGHLYSKGRSCVDVLVLSHLHEDHAGGAVMLMEMIDVNTLVLPKGYDEEERLFREIMDCAFRNGIETIYVDEDCTMTVGDIDINLIKSGYGEDENERCIITKIELNDFELLAMADASYKMEKKLVDEYDLESVDALVVSHHGSKYSSTDELLKEIEGKIAVISVGYNYFGHPSQETIEALDSYGYNVYRTDLDGNIEIKIGNDYGKKSWETRRKIELPR